MTQLGESIAINPPAGPEKCVFCGKDHQKEKAAAKHTFERDMTKLKKEGREATIENGARAAKYPPPYMSPLEPWEKDITKTMGYKAAAHHGIALTSASKHELSGEMNEAKYDPNNGNNCIWLPYSKPQFSRARAYGRPLQKHRGGHTNVYFDKVTFHLNEVRKLCKKAFCDKKKTGSKKKLLNFLKSAENDIWEGVTSPELSAYHLYNESYLEPDLKKAPWGKYDYEKGIDQIDLIARKTPTSDDAEAEKESKDDTEVAT